VLAEFLAGVVKRETPPAGGDPGNWECARCGGGPRSRAAGADGEIVQCASFLEQLTAAPLRGFGEDPAHVEALPRDDPEALRLFRKATTAPPHKHLDSDNVTIKPRRGNSRAYRLTRLQRRAPDL